MKLKCITEKSGKTEMHPGNVVKFTIMPLVINVLRCTNTHTHTHTHTLTLTLTCKPKQFQRDST